MSRSNNLFVFASIDERSFVYTVVRLDRRSLISSVSLVWYIVRSAVYADSVCQTVFGTCQSPLHLIIGQWLFHDVHINLLVLVEILFSHLNYFMTLLFCFYTFSLFSYFHIYFSQCRKLRNLCSKFLNFVCLSLRSC